VCTGDAPARDFILHGPFTFFYLILPQGRSGQGRERFFDDENGFLFTHEIFASPGVLWKRLKI